MCSKKCRVQAAAAFRAMLNVLLLCKPLSRQVTALPYDDFCFVRLIYRLIFTRKKEVLELWQMLTS